MNKQEMYIVKYNDIYGNGYYQKLEVIVENRNHFLEWLEEHNESRGGSEPELEEEFDLIPLSVYVSKFKNQ
jgi:hypothetical protein